MESPLWIEKCKPSIEEFPQDDVRNTLKTVSQTDMNLVIGGPKGVGKTAAAEAILDEIHKDTSNDVSVINITDIFNRTKKELVNKQQFAQIASSRRNMSKRDLVNELIKEISSYPPVTGGFKTIILDNAENSREDFQQSLRRTMERYSKSTQFVFTTRNPSNLISPLKSRCHSIQIRPPKREEIEDIVNRIESKENVEFDENGIDYIWSQSKPNVREFLMHLQTTHINHDSVTPQNAAEVLNQVSKDEEIENLLNEARNQNYKSVKDDLSDLMDEEGYNAELMLELIVETGVSSLSEDESVELCKLVDEADFKMQNSTDPRTQVVELLADWSSNI